jgi:hypothetical protein
MASSKEDIASQALARLGEPSISAFDENTETAERVRQLYEDTILDLLGCYEWQFASARQALPLDGAVTPANEWEYAFLMPALRTVRVGNPIRVYNSTSLRARPVFDYELEGKHILTNYKTIVVEFIERKAESLWPGYFVRLAREALAANLALPITENASKEQYHQQIAFGTPSEGGEGGLFGRAMAADSRYAPTRSLLDDSDPMAEARFGGSGTGGTW